MAKKLVALALVVTAGAGWGPAAQAQDQAGALPSAEVFDALKACRAIADDGARLACFDEASARLTAAVEAKEIVVVEDKDIKQTKRSLFGFKLPSLRIFGGSDEESEADQTLTSTVASIRPLQSGKYMITLAEGAVWQTTEGLPFPPKAGDPVEIRKAALGSFFLKVGRRRAVRAMRVE